jgi:hypothetical protein
LPPEILLPGARQSQDNTPTFDVRTALYGVLGVDVTEIHGLGPSLALKLVGGSEGVAERQALHLRN